MNDKYLSHKVQDIGPDDRRWLELQLVQDLRHYGFGEGPFVIDWSHIVEEGEDFELHGASVENFSEVRLRNLAGELVGEGQMGFVFPDTRAELPLVFWVELVRIDGKSRRHVKEGSGILPDHIWRQVSDSVKMELRNAASRDVGYWRRDPKVNQWDTAV